MLLVCHEVTSTAERSGVITIACAPVGGHPGSCALRELRVCRRTVSQVGGRMRASARACARACVRACACACVRARSRHWHLRPIEELAPAEHGDDLASAMVKAQYTVTQVSAQTPNGVC